MDLFDLEWEFLENVIEKLDCGELVVLRVDLQDSQPCAVIDRGVLVVLLFAGAGDGFDELDVDLYLMSWERLLVAFPAAVVGLVSLVGGEPVEVEAL